MNRLVAAFFGERSGELLDAAANLVECFGAGRELALERDAQVRFENVLLPKFRLPRIERLRRRNRIAAPMFREIHRRIRHLNELLRRRTMNRKAGDAETRGDVFIAKQRI